MRQIKLTLPLVVLYLILLNCLNYTLRISTTWLCLVVQGVKSFSFTPYSKSSREREKERMESEIAISYTVVMQLFKCYCVCSVVYIHTACQSIQ